MNYTAKKSDPIVQVVMATYNGEKYIKKQIESIFSQKGCKIQLLIRDDGSTDGTIEEIRKLKSKYNIKLIIGNSHEGVAKGFLQALKVADKAEYYAFSDQDDIWFDDKIQVAIEKLEKVKDSSAVYVSNLYIMNEETPTNIKMWSDKDPFITEYKQLLVNHTSHMFGCTMVLNYQLYENVCRKLPQNPRMHDEWIGLVASLTGSIIYDSVPHMYHRIHQENVVGGFLNKTDVWKWRIQRLFGKKRGQMAMQAKDMLDCFPRELMKKQGDLKYTKIVSSYNNGFKERIIYLRNFDHVMMTKKQFMFHVFLGLLNLL